MPIEVSPRELVEAVAANQTYPSKAAAARALGIPVNTYKHRLDMASRPSTGIKGRKELGFSEGIVIIFSDAHYWPGEPSTAHRALIKFIKRLKPAVIVCNGDALDAACISRHPPIGWNHLPSVKDELEVCQERLGEIAKAGFKAKRYWTLGNHDARFETRLATVAPEFKDVHGISLRDHFPDWEGCWSLFLGDERGVVVKHRFKGGLHAPHNNTVSAGRSIITGHLHSLKITPFSDYNGTRFGVDGGTLADIYHQAFQDYTEDNPKNWRSGFVVLTFKNGRLLWPEVCHVIGPNKVEFRGEEIDV